MRDGVNDIGPKIETALDSHFQRWGKVDQAAFDHFKTVLKTAGCDVYCVQQCIQTSCYRQYYFESAYRESNAQQVEDGEHAEYFSFNCTYEINADYFKVDHRSGECRFFEKVKINQGSIHNQKIAEEEYGKLIDQFPKKERAQSAQSLNAY